MGTRLAPFNSPSQILHPAGKKTLTTASLASASHARTPLLELRAARIEEISPVMHGQIYSSRSYYER
ncbi:MAG: hypothetical protein WA817_07445 [Candidatus Acidiferrum sp.]